MYYPLSQIKTNLYTNGKEYAYILSNKEYIGYYWKSSDGKIFSGRTPQDAPVEELTLITTYDSNISSNNTFLNINQEEINNTAYLNIKNISVNDSVYIPPYSPTLPTSQDYQIGEFVRYFCKKSNEVIYIEISQDTYNLLLDKDPRILWQLYIPFNIPWQITGDKQTVAKTNKNIVELTMFKNKYYRFNDYLKNDYLKYFK
jgi:hypothetical protein